MRTLILAGHGPWHDGNHSGSGWWVLFPIAFGLFWLLVLGGGGYLLWRRTKKTPGAESVLAERYARGEIDEEEYRERLAVLRS